MISVITMCYDRQHFLDVTLPRWLTIPKDIEYEVVVCHGPNIELPDDPKIKSVLIDGPQMNRAYNKGIYASKYDTLLFTQSDIIIHDPHQIKRMADMHMPSLVVTDRIVKYGVRDPGIYMYMTMVSKDKVLEVGGWPECYDGGDTYAFEDADLMASLLKNGMYLKIVQSPDALAANHIDHLRPDYNSQELIDRLAAGRKLYKSRHPVGIEALFAKQMARNMMNAGYRVL